MTAMGRLLQPLKRTLVSQQDYLDSLQRAWEALFGYSCSSLVAGVLLGQYAFETGWGKSCWYYNLGNRRRPDGWQGDWCELPSADEYINGKRVIVGGYFCAFDSLNHGMEDHLTFLSTLPRYRMAWTVLQNAAHLPATPEVAASVARSVVAALKAGGYFTGDEPTYANGVASIASQFVAKVHERDTRPDPAVEVQSYIVDPRDHQFDLFVSEWGKDLDAALSDIFGDEYVKSFGSDDSARVALVTACRYDCEETV